MQFLKQPIVFYKGAWEEIKWGTRVPTMIDLIYSSKKLLLIPSAYQLITWELSPQPSDFAEQDELQSETLPASRVRFALLKENMSAACVQWAVVTFTWLSHKLLVLQLYTNIESKILVLNALINCLIFSILLFPRRDAWLIHIKFE